MYRGEESKPVERCKKSDEALKLTRQEMNLSSSILNKYEWSVSVLLGNSKHEVMKPESEFSLCRHRDAAAQNGMAKCRRPGSRT